MKFAETLKRNPGGVIVFIDDHKEEHTFIKHALEELGITNKVISCMDGIEAFNYLKNTKEDIFIVLSDLNMPHMDGLELKRLIEITPELKIKAIPFIFHSNTASRAEIKAAYASNIQGFVRKGKTMAETVANLQNIFLFWGECIHPKDL